MSDHPEILLPPPPIIMDEIWSRLKALVLDSVPAKNSKRLYNAALNRFYVWYFDEPRLPFGKAIVQEYLASLQRRDYAPSTSALNLSALRKLANEAADNGLLDPQIAGGVSRIRAPRRLGCCVGNWLTSAQAAALIRAPKGNTLKCFRDRALLAVAVGCGLRRSEIAALTVEHLQFREDRWIIADLIGKNQRVRTIPIPSFVMSFVDPYIARAELTNGRLFRSINRADAMRGESMSSQAVYAVIKGYASILGLPTRPHDLRRSFAKFTHAGGAPLEQIQYSLGHASIMTTERYLGLQQNLTDAPGDRICLPLEAQG